LSFCWFPLRANIPLAEGPDALLWSSTRLAPLKFSFTKSVSMDFAPISLSSIPTRNPLAFSSFAVFIAMSRLIQYSPTPFA